MAFRPLVMAIVKRALGPARRQDWEDLVQAVLLKLFRNLGKWQEGCPFCKFVAVLAGRRCIDWLRCERPMAAFAPEMLVDHRGPPVSEAVIARLECVAATFPANLQVAWRSHCEGLKTEDIAVRVGRAARTVRLWLAEVRRELAKCLDDV